MGFLGEIERRKQQAIQQELNRKAELERQQQLTAQKVAQKAAEEKREKERLEGIPRGFLKDGPIITSLLDQLYQFGYKGYFENVSEISGFQLWRISYTEYPRVYLGADEKILASEILEKGSETTKQQLRVQEKLKDASSQLGWTKSLDNKHPDVMFFGDNVTGKAEPSEVGIGIRFSKRVKFRKHYTKEQNREYDEVIKQWDHNVYVRIDSHNGATITGSNQRQVSLRDLKLFDEALEQAIHNPAKVYTQNTYHYTISLPNRQIDGGGPCLPGNSLISTPEGHVLIKNLKSGDFVWTVDKFGRKIRAPIIQKTKRLVSKDHKMAHIVLEDGRKLIVSPGHPTIDNKELGSLKVGQILDKSQIVSIQIISYKEKYTYDILPSGDTEGYWANKILIGSTLSNQFKQTHNFAY